MIDVSTQSGEDPNSILIFIRRHLDDEIGLSELSERTAEVVAQATDSELFDAEDHFLNSRTEPRELSVSANLLASIASGLCGAERAFNIHFTAAETLSLHRDIETLGYTLEHFRAVESGPLKLRSEIGEAQTHIRLALIGENIKDNRNAAKAICDRLLPTLEAGAPEHFDAMEIIGMLMIVTGGLPSLCDVSEAIIHFDNLISASPYPSQRAGVGNYYRAFCSKQLAYRKLDPTMDLSDAIIFLDRAKACIDAILHVDQYAKVLSLEASVRILMARECIELDANANAAMDLLEALREIEGERPRIETRIMRVEANLLLATSSIVPHVEYMEEAAIELDATRIASESRPAQLQYKLAEGRYFWVLANTRGFSNAHTTYKQALLSLYEAMCVGLRWPQKLVEIIGLQVDCHLRLAEYGLDSVYHLESAVMKCLTFEKEVIRPIEKSDPDLFDALRRKIYLKRAVVHAKLSDLGVESSIHLATAFHLQSNFEFDPDARNYESLQFALDAAITMRKRAMSGVDSLSLLQRSRSQCQHLVDITAATDRSAVIKLLHAHVLGELGNICFAFASLEQTSHPEEQLGAAIDYSQRAYKYIICESTLLGFLMNQAVYRLALCTLGVNVKYNAERAKQIAEDSSKQFRAGSLGRIQGEFLVADALSFLNRNEQATKRLMHSLSEADAFRVGQSSDEARRAFASTIHTRYSQAISNCLKNSKDSKIEIERKNWIKSAWKLVRETKARSLDELFLGLESEREVLRVASTEDILRCVKENCPTDRALIVEYFTFGTNQAVVFLVTTWQSDVEVECIKFGLPSKVIEDLIIQTLSSNESHTPFKDGFENLPSVASLFLQPIQERLESLSPTELVLAPHFYLHFLSLHAALIGEVSLIDQYPVSYLPTSVIATRIGADNMDVGLDALLVADPCDNLKRTRSEVRLIEATLSKSNINSMKLISSEATIEAVTSASANGIVHFSCHGVLEYRFEQSGLELADGRLTPADIANLDLSNTSLVFLSTCTGGLSITGPNDDFMALARPFFAAGARSVIASVWVASETAGEVFANNLYHQWLEKSEPLSIAFQQATIHTRMLFPEPQYWASFVLLGHPDPPRPSHSLG